MKAVFSIVVAAAIALLVTAGKSAIAGDPAGTWLTADGDARIRLAPCGTGFCGTLVWLDKPLDPDTGKPFLDKQNPDASKRRRPLVGIQILVSMQPNGSGKWSGPIYNSDDGNTYQGNIALVNAETLKVEGCLMNVCQSENWTRAK